MRYNALRTRLALLLMAVLVPFLAHAYDPDAVQAQKSSNDSLAAAAHGTETHKAGFDPGHMIMDHIADAHDWHLWGHTHLPLPVIVKTDKGIELFSSSHFINHETHHLDAVYKGTHYSYKLAEGKIVVVDEVTGMENEEATHQLLDLSITKNVVTILMLFGLMLFVFISVAKAYQKRPGQAPKGLQSWVEPFIIFIRDDLAKASIGPKYAKFMPYLLTVFFFIFFANLLGLVPIFPGGANVTGNIAVTLVLSTITLIITLINGNGHYWRHIFAMPGVPAFVLIILTPIEILGIFLRPFVLMIRLFANISAGHIIALAFYSLIFIFGNEGQNVAAGLGVSVVSIAFTVFMFVMELLVAFLQAYVFTLLSAIYFGSAVEEHHHDDHAHDHAHAAAH